ncbi:MAG: hypothetical protein ACTSXL_00200 [Alphaproteobacteria bacterium]
MENKTKNFYFNDLMDSIKNMSPLDNDEKEMFNKLKKSELNEIFFVEINKNVLENLRTQSEAQGLDCKDYIDSVV